MLKIKHLVIEHPPKDIYLITSKWMSGDADAFHDFSIKFDSSESHEVEKCIKALKWLQSNPRDSLQNRRSIYDNPFYDFAGYDEEGAPNAREDTELDWFEGVPRDVIGYDQPAGLIEFNIFYFDLDGNKHAVEYISE